MKAWLALLLAGCGGTAVIDGGSGGGSGNATTTTTTSNGSTATTTTTTTTGGAMPCSDHGACPGGVCIFSIGVCAPSCQAESCDSCGPGTVCDPCATSSCPKCNDCMAACIPTRAGQCDDDDACPANQVCVHRRRLCAPSCNVQGNCGDTELVCVDCVSGSCCGCKNCVSACVPPDF